MNDIPTLDKAQCSPTLREKVGQFFMPAVFINDTEEEIQKVENLIKECGIGSICFFHSRASAATNYEGKKEVIYNAKSLNKLKELIARYQATSKYPLLIAIDGEWGLAMRIEETPQYPYALTLGAIEDNNLIKKVGEYIGHDCREAGIHWNLCPSVDINNNPDNPVIGYRSFGDNPEQVYQKAKAFITGMNKSGVLNSVKHFPGHGDTAVDSHLGLPRIDKSKEELLKNELYPFKKLIRDGVDSVMVGHLAVPSISHSDSRSSTISKPIVTDLIRDEFGYSGVIITDALNMHSVSKLYTVKGQLEWEAFKAGNDVLCFAENTAEGIQLILENATNEQIEKSFRRVWTLKQKTFSSQNVKSSATDYEALMHQLAENSLTQIKGNKNDIKSFYKLGFEFLEFGNQNESFFSSQLKEHKVDTLRKVIAIFPSEMKPTNNFGLQEKDINQVNAILKESDCLLYLFGNPYALRLFDYQHANAVLIAYQDFDAFQNNASENFYGRSEAKGKLPVRL